MSKSNATGQDQEEEHSAEAVLLVNGEEVKVDKHLLASNSDYFNCFFFAKDYKKNNQILLDPPATVDDFKRMLNTLHPVNRPLDDQCVEGVLHLADQFFVLEVKQKCSTFLAGDSKHLAMSKYRFADKYGLETLKQQILDQPEEAFSQYYDMEDLAEMLEEYAQLDEPARQALTNSLKKRMAQITEYANLIGVPIVANLYRNYGKEKMLQLIKHGNSISKSLYIQEYQWLDDKGLVQCIVDLLANAEKPEKMIGEVTIEFESMVRDTFQWPQNVELRLKEKKSNVTIELNGASDPWTYSGWNLAEYELANKGCQFKLLLYYGYENQFNSCVNKFVYRRLDEKMRTGMEMQLVQPENGGGFISGCAIL